MRLFSLTILICVSSILGQNASNNSTLTSTIGNDTSSTQSTSSNSTNSTISSPNSTNSTNTGSNNTNSTDNSSNNSTADIPANYPSGRLDLIKPANEYNSLVLFGIGSNVSFAWKYGTYLRILPEYLIFDIKVPGDQSYYTIGSNITNTTEWVWDTSSFNQTKLTQGKGYTLFISNQNGPTASPEPGQLAPFSLSFNMYNPVNGPICATCLSSAISHHVNHIALGLAMLVMQMLLY
ncbi:hypothetical protein K7432_003370 [Basidiobolus ranarum]|uniref:DUF7137 domain-containing protein n=1 Tax=Basidiobolus ranarum TaxID=34480 RepID=A0ABR2W6A9_9FUNG